MSPIWKFSRQAEPVSSDDPTTPDGKHAAYEAPPQSERLFDADEFATDTAEREPVEPEDARDADAVPDENASPARHVRRRRSRRTYNGSTKAVGRRSELAEGAVADGEDPDSAPVATEPRGRFAGLGDALVSFARTAGMVLLIIAVLLASMYGVAVGVNAFARWNARRIAALNATPTSPVEDNLLVIGVSDGVAVGFTALKAERANNRVLGIAIPDGAFMEVPGQGFERVGASYVGGAGVSKDTVTNYLGVPFRKYVVVDGTTYQTLLKDQNVAALMDKVMATDLAPGQSSAFREYFARVSAKDVWIVPLPVKPVTVGDQQYFEPQRTQVADLLLQWWGVQPTSQKATPRVIVYNGVGTPGLAGLASQQLIRAGLRVVDSGNADNFNHKETLILLYHGTGADAAAVRRALGVGRAVVQSASQDLADMIVIIGSDYRPPTADVSTVPTEGAQ